MRVSKRMPDRGECPGDWQVKRLADLVGGVTSLTKSVVRGSTTIPFIPMSLLPQDALYAERWEIRAARDVRSGIPIQEGDLLLAKITPCMENGRQGIVRGLPSGWGYATTEVIPLRCTGVSTEFLAFYLKLPRVRSLLASKMEGATGRQRLPRAVIDALPVPLPSLSEQRAIVHVLRSVQRAKKAGERVIAAAREMKRSLMHYLFTYGPVPVGEADHVPLNETEIGPVPAHWRVAALRECATVQTGVAKGRAYPAHERVVTLPYLRVANVQDGYLDLTGIKSITLRYDDIQRYRLEAGDVLLTEGGDFDKLGCGFIWNAEIRDCIHQNHIFAVRAVDSIMTPQYLAYFVQSHTAKSYFLRVAHRTTHLACINSTKLRELPVLLPDKQEQQQIVLALRTVDRQIEVALRRKQALEVLFGTLLDNLMTGRARVNDLDVPGVGGRLVGGDGVNG